MRYLRFPPLSLVALAAMRYLQFALLGVLALVLTAPRAQAESSKLVSMPAFGDVLDFQISPDGAYVVYRADQDSDGVDELYSVPIGGGASVKLNGAMVAGGDVGNVEISPDSSRVVYQADQDTDGVDELYSVPTAGPASAGVKLNGPVVSGGDVLDFEISPDSSRVVYQADQDTDGVIELYSVLIAGPASADVKLNQPIASGGSVLESEISPDSSRVVYRADQETNDCDELYSVPIAGPAGAGVKLNHEEFFSFDDVYDFEISPDSSTVVYRAHWVDETIEVMELYRVPIDGGLVVKVVQLPSTYSDVFSYQISPDSSRVVYAANQDTVIIGTSRVQELYSKPLYGPTGSCFGPPVDVCLTVTVTKLNGALVDGGDVGMPWPWAPDFLISPDGTTVVYGADQDFDDDIELYSVPIAGPASAGVKLNGPMLNWVSDIMDFAISPDSSRVAYTGDLDTGIEVDLYSVPIAGPASAGAKLNDPLDAGFMLSDFEISMDSSRVVYMARLDNADSRELYGVPIAGPASAAVTLNGSLVTGGNVAGFRVSPDGSRVVYRADQDTDGVVELYAYVFGPPEDSDGDGVPDSSDNCPAWPNADQSLPPWTVPADDPDCDAWSTDDENSIGTDPLAACGVDCWPPDITDSQAVDFLDLNAIVPFLFQSASGNERYNLSVDAAIDFLDLNAAVPFLFTSCEPP